VSYCTPAPELRQAVWLLRHGGTVVVDSRETLDELGQVLGGGDGSLPGRLFVRVNPGGLPGYQRTSDIQRYTAHGGDTSQFGIPSEEVPSLLSGYPLLVSGLHMHVGTMMDNAATFAAGLDLLHALVDLLLADTVHPVTTVNLGGGLGIPFFPQQSFPTVERLARELAPRLRQELDYEVEPGNSLVGDSFALLTRVTGTKTTRGRRWAIADVGTDQLVKHTVARWEHQIVGPDHRPLPQEGPDALAGPLCFAGDVLLPATDLGSIRKGDPLLVRHAGAYCGAIASRFNGRIAPACAVLEHDGTVRLAHTKEDPFFDPMLQTYRSSGFDCDPNRGEAVTPQRQHALHSEYMHELASQDGYDMRSVRKVCERSYHFQVEPRAAVGFVALPLALRIVGDASILAVGHELGWESKEAPVWATRLTLTAGATLPVDSALPCRVVVSGLAPGGRPGVAASGHVHFELGDNGEFRGTAKVSVPES
jgi:diaminopimelate decarboxylase